MFVRNVIFAPISEELVFRSCCLPLLLAGGVRPCTGICMYVCLYVCLYVCVVCVYVFMYACLYICMHTCVYMSVFTYLHAYAHTYTHTHTPSCGNLPLFLRYSTFTSRYRTEAGLLRCQSDRYQHCAPGVYVCIYVCM